MAEFIEEGRTVQESETFAIGFDCKTLQFRIYHHSQVAALLTPQQSSAMVEQVVNAAARAAPPR